jgi:hypothetical protein
VHCESYTAVCRCYVVAAAAAAAAAATNCLLVCGQAMGGFTLGSQTGVSHLCSARCIRCWQGQGKVDAKS